MLLSGMPDSPLGCARWLAEARSRRPRSWWEAERLLIRRFQHSEPSAS